MRGRAITVAVLVVATAVVAAVLLGGGGGGYRVTAVFSNASLLVHGDQVKTGGVPIGSVRDIRLGPRGQAQVELEITDDRYAPLRAGTEAIARQTSLAGVANRYVDLRLAGATGRPIDAGGTIPAADTLSAVELDQLFNTFDGRTRKALSALVRGSGGAWQGRGADARLGLLYLDPAVASSTRLLATLDRARPRLHRFLGSSARLAGDLGSQDEHVAGVVDHLATTMGAIDRRRGDLGDAIARAPAVLRRSDSTLVELRATLDDLQPLVRDARPLAHALPAFSERLRTLAVSSRPTLRRLDRLVRSPGRADDAVDLLRLLPGVRDASTRAVRANGAERPAALPTIARSLRELAPQLAFLRPYAVDATGWFDDFGHTGVYDALGGMGRIAFHGLGFANVGGTLTFVPPDLRQQAFDQVAARGQRNRCPGSMERGAAWKPTPDFDCDPRQVPVGP
jgi:phospholipid/cholesterol/gamma-HCH transport system substrate-binding protein